MAAVFCFSLNLKAQDNVAINATGASPDPSAMLDVASTSKGLLMPRMTTAQRDAITSPADGLMIVNTTSNCVNIYLYGAWQDMFCGTPPPPAAKIMFTTVGTITGNMSGGTAGDALCQSEADAAGLSGTFKALLKDPAGGTPLDRWGAVPANYDGGITLPSGSVVANNWSDLTDGSISTAPTSGADGTPVVGAFVWTGLNVGFTPGEFDNASAHCINWSSTSGSGARGTTNASTCCGGFVFTSNSSCSSALKLYCIQQ